ncbi:hypothetical protein cyc_06400 [Cyclospora cayetanensis]|uniref:Uncharacterized protein n=1 Tax=Cyclospora cayetanensis TaxID=88456 RepID=A0A1D3D7E9_9EIME|nr:hypothetical protein cyc_06400 [Cyclospora cayetanensis]
MLALTSSEAKKAETVETPFETTLAGPQVSSSIYQAAMKEKLEALREMLPAAQHLADVLPYDGCNDLGGTPFVKPLASTFASLQKSYRDLTIQLMAGAVSLCDGRLFQSEDDEELLWRAALDLEALQRVSRQEFISNDVASRMSRDTVEELKKAEAAVASIDKCSELIESSAHLDDARNHMSSAQMIPEKACQAEAAMEVQLVNYELAAIMERELAQFSKRMANEGCIQTASQSWWRTFFSA